MKDGSFTAHDGDVEDSKVDACLFIFPPWSPVLTGACTLPCGHREVELVSEGSEHRAGDHSDRLGGHCAGRTRGLPRARCGLVFSVFTLKPVVWEELVLV